MADLTLAVAQSHAEAPHQTGHSTKLNAAKQKLQRKVLKFNRCHDPKTGEFCDTSGGAGTSFRGLSQDEETAVHQYTRLFKGANTILRLIGPKGQDISDTGADRNTRFMIEHLDKVMKSHPLPADTTLFRVAPEKVAAKLKEGDVIQDFAYTSTSKATESMEQIAADIGLVKGQKKLKTVEITIRAPKGMGHVDVNAVMQAEPSAAPHRYHHQQEVLLPRGTKFKVVFKKKNTKGVLELVLEAQT